MYINVMQIVHLIFIPNNKNSERRQRVGRGGFQLEQRGELHTPAHDLMEGATRVNKNKQINKSKHLIMDHDIITT